MLPACTLLQVKVVIRDGLVAGEKGPCPLLFGPQGQGWATLAPQEIHGRPLGSRACPGEAELPGLPGGRAAGQAVHVFLLDVLIGGLQGREQEVIQAPSVDGVHHVTDQVDLSSQVLDSGT